MHCDKIIVADDHPMFRDGLCRQLEARAPGARILEASNVAEVFGCIDREGAPDLFMLDLLFPGMSPRETLKALRQSCPKSSIIIVSMIEDAATVEKLMDYGADGYIVKSITADEMMDAVERVCAGQYVVARPSQSGLVGQLPEIADIMELSQRQKEILALIAAGKSNKQIGREVALSPFTVRNHISVLFRIFKAQTRAELAAKAVGAAAELSEAV